MCRVEECERGSVALGLCHKHYQAFDTAGALGPLYAESNRQAELKALAPRAETIFTPKMSKDPKYAIPKHRVTQVQLNFIWSRQNGACAICRDLFRDISKLCVDHDHSCCPGERSCGSCVRGLLCGNCNSAIGFLRDDADLVIEAARYLNWDNALSFSASN